MGKQDRLAGAARLVDIELAADDAGAEFGHPAQGGGLAAITMLQRPPRKASSTPGDGRIGTLTPAIAAIFSDHGPVALTITSAWISPSLPV